MATNYKDLLMDENGDLYIGNGDARLVGGADRVRQSWLITIRLFKGEWFLNLNKGVPYIQKVFSKTVTDSQLRQIFYAESMRVPGVVRVNSIEVGTPDPTTRKCPLTVDLKIEGEEEGSFVFRGN